MSDNRCKSLEHSYLRQKVGKSLWCSDLRHWHLSSGGGLAGTTTGRHHHLADNPQHLYFRGLQAAHSLSRHALVVQAGTPPSMCHYLWAQ